MENLTHDHDIDGSGRKRHRVDVSNDGRDSGIPGEGGSCPVMFKAQRHELDTPSSGGARGGLRDIPGSGAEVEQRPSSRRARSLEERNERFDHGSAATEERVRSPDVRKRRTH